MDILSARDLRDKAFDTYRLGGTLGAFLGNLYAGAKLFVYADRFGVGKSFLSTAIAHAWALDHETSGRNALYVSPEEGLSVTSQARVEQLGATAPALLFGEFTTMDALKGAIRERRVGFVVLDSISKIDPHSRMGESFLEWCTRAGVTVLYVAQAVKGGTFRGSNRVPHEVDVVVRVTRDADNQGSTALIEKSRLGPEVWEIPVPFTPKALRALLGSSDSAVDRPGTEGWAPTRSRRRRRTNPVKVPFTVSVGELAERHRVRSASRLNKLVGWESPCVIELLGDTDRIPKGDTERAMHERAAHAKFGFAYKTRSRIPKGGSKEDRRRVKILTVKVWGEAADGDDLFDRQACEPSRRPADVYEYTGEDFQECLGAFVRAFKKVRLVVHDQTHAKTVLGAAEYRRQEKAQAKATTAKATTAKPEAKAAKPKRAKPAAQPKAKTTSAKPKKKRAKKQTPPKVAKPRPAETSGDGAAVPAELAAADDSMDRIETLLRSAIEKARG